jgi:polar amino acid transport system permease protein
VNDSSSANSQDKRSAPAWWQAVRSCFWQSPEERRIPPPWGVLVLNWGLAFLLLSLIVCFSFASLRYNWNWDAISSYSSFFWRGWLTTIQVSAFALVLSTLIGTLSALARRSGFFILRALSRIYVETIRGTPLLVQVSFAFYVVASAFHLENRLVVGVATLAIFSGAYISEIVRGGIESIGASQLESARAIGLTRFQTYRYVIFPQAIRVILPGLAGMFASLIKDSSLLSVISIAAFTWSAQQVGGLTYSLFETYIPLAIGYLVLTLPITLWTQWLERKTKFET